jgi:hypothetical protein
MRSLKGSALVVAAVFALALAAQAGAGAPTVVSTTYAVSGLSVPGSSTGLVLTSGMTVTVTAGGAVCPFGDSFCPGPDGYAPWDTTTTSYGGFPLPGGPAWGLVGRVGSGPWVQIGTGPTTLTGTGELAFAVNDDLLVDNAGSFTVTVSYSCWPGWGYGDENHHHCGPPGLVGKEAPSTQSTTDGKGAGAADTAPNGSGPGNGNGPGNGMGPGNGNGSSSAAGSTPNGKGNGLAKH